MFNFFLSFVLLNFLFLSWHFRESEREGDERARKKEGERGGRKRKGKVRAQVVKGEEEGDETHELSKAVDYR